ncbi:MAG: hypothetical protein A2017_15540 [Lentisphaerae bacterium GWF2_44_16]|nr:MAG: hypothetical protein A2017_15540 [Lentisphaerae bacterium GWF2_44_16]
MATHIQGGIFILGAMALCCAVSMFSAESKKVSIAPVQPKTSVNSPKEQSETETVFDCKVILLNIYFRLSYDSIKTKEFLTQVYNNKNTDKRLHQPIKIYIDSL